MPKFDVPCVWQMFGIYYGVEAENLREAINKVNGNLPLPNERGYVSDSLVPDEIDTLYEANNMEIPTLSKKEIVEELDRRTDPRVEMTSCFNPSTAHYSIDELIGVLRDYYDTVYDF